MANIQIGQGATGMLPQLPLPSLPTGGQTGAPLAGIGGGSASNIMSIIGDVLQFVLPLLMAL